MSACTIFRVMWTLFLLVASMETLNRSAIKRPDTEACVERLQIGEAASRQNAARAGVDAHEEEENKEAGAGPPGPTAWRPYFISGNALCLSVCPG